MSRPAFLLDTNVFIPLEDNREVLAEYQQLQRKAAEHDLRLCVHEATKRDIFRDRDIDRRKISLSKLGKFQMLVGLHLPPVPQLESQFGPISDDNELVDVELLSAVALGNADFLVTQDDGIHARARRAGVSNCVLRVEDALSWIEASFGRATVVLPFIQDVHAQQLNFDAPIFQGVRADYADFDAWARKCRKEQRRVWLIERNGEYAAVTIVKEEDAQHADINLGVAKLLKLGLFKVSERHAGLRLGELLLKKALRYATRNGFEAIYLTAFPKHRALVELCESVGFNIAGKKGDELIVAKKLVGAPPDEASLLDAQRFLFPRFRDGADVRKVVVPIEAAYHERLFPEASGRKSKDLLDLIRRDAGEDAIAGNTIRKVYVTRSLMQQIGPGDLLLFYVMKNDMLAASQAITYVGVVESVRDALSAEDLVRMTSKRTAYLRTELEKITKLPGTPRVIEFLAIGRLDPPLALLNAQQSGILVAAPQSLMQLSSAAYRSLAARSKVSF